MAWKQRVVEIMTDTLRFAAHGTLLLNAIALSIFSVYFVCKFLWFAMDWLNRTMFSAPWGTGG